MTKVHLIPILNDNYSYLIESGDDNVLVDPGEAKTILTWLSARDIAPTKILITHHHGDHIAGTLPIKEKYSCEVFGPAAEQSKIPGIDKTVSDGEEILIGDKEHVAVMSTPGHTLGHIVYFFPQSKLLFAGDTLFSLGCGRLFEGTPEQMFASLQRLHELPDDVLLYCGHEYTTSNADFCLSVDSKNEALKKRIDEIKKLRANDQPTLPVLLGTEKQTNIFLRTKNSADFAALRKQKDSF